MKEQPYAVIGQVTLGLLVVVGFGVGSWLISWLFVNWLEVMWDVSESTHIPYLLTFPLTVIALGLIPSLILKSFRTPRH